jgi:tRNA(Ile)-lysidine synthase
MLSGDGAASSPLVADALLAPLAAQKSLLLAVSGGPDSVALMLLASRWSLRKEREIAVATVDHGLREGSREEAERVGDWARALGFEHHLLSWEGAKPTSRLQERAREARYALLAACAKKIGTRAIVTAHHADDQAETILFRLTRGSGVAGLAGMAAASSCGDVALLRPLLGVFKQELEALCDSASHPFVHDPSNENETFARVRLRKLSTTLAAQGLNAAALLRLGSRAARADQALSCCAARALREATLSRDENETRLDAQILRDLPVEILQRVLASDVLRLGEASNIRLERLERAAEALATALSRGSPMRITLAGASIELRRDSVVLRRAPPRRAAAAFKSRSANGQGA